MRMTVARLSAVLRWRFLVAVLGAAFLDDRVTGACRSETISGDIGVVAAVEVDRVDLEKPHGRVDRLESRFEKDRVVVIRPVDHPDQRDAVRVDPGGPFPSEFLPVSGVRAGALTSAGRLV